MNNTQRNTLDKIYRDEYSKLKSELVKTVDKTFEEGKQAILDKTLAKHKKLVNAIAKVNELYAEAKPLLEADGLELENLDRKKDVVIRFKYFYRYSSDNEPRNKELLKLDLAREKALDEIKSKENEIRKVIWGENLSYEDMEAKLNLMFVNLRKTAETFNEKRS